MKKTLLFLTILSATQIKSQDYLGFNQSNYAGVTGVYQQPASIADGRMKFDMTLGGTSIYAYNNYVSMKHDALNKTASWGTIINNIDKIDKYFPNFNDPKFSTNYLSENINAKDKSVYVANG